MPMKEISPVATPLRAFDFRHRKDRLPRLTRWASVEKTSFWPFFKGSLFFSRISPWRNAGVGGLFPWMI
jgi:hypothetical protein